MSPSRHGDRAVPDANPGAVACAEVASRRGGLRMDKTWVRRIGTTFVTMPPRAKVAAAVVVVALLLGTTWIVAATGGVRFAALHLMYVPVVLAGLAFGVPGG